MREMMAFMQDLQLFQYGEYMVIYIDMMTYDIREAHKYWWSKEKSLVYALKCDLNGAGPLFACVTVCVSMFVRGLTHSYSWP